MKNPLLPILLLAGTLLCAGASAQQGNPPATVRVTIAPVATLSINDVDFKHATSPKLLFTIDIDAHGRTIDAVLSMHLSVKTADGESFDDALLVVTYPFEVRGWRTITNLDIDRGAGIRDSIYQIDAAARRRFESTALPAGVMPAGTYRFDVVVTEVGGGSGEGSGTLYLLNPSSVELLFPFDGDQAVASFPLFQWQFDGTRSRISIFEKVPGQRSAEEAASGVALLQANVSGSTFQYPSAGVRALLPGRTYVWYVEGLVASAGGSDVVYRSQLRSFTVAAPGAGAAASLLDEIERSVGPKYQPLFDQLRAEGMSPSGTFQLNGEAISLTDLMRILNRMKENPDAVTSVRSE